MREENFSVSAWGTVARVATYSGVGDRKPKQTNKKCQSIRGWRGLGAPNHEKKFG
jgi:hypothetical protein